MTDEEEEVGSHALPPAGLALQRPGLQRPAPPATPPPPWRVGGREMPPPPKRRKTRAGRNINAYNALWGRRLDPHRRGGRGGGRGGGSSGSGAAWASR